MDAEPSRAMVEHFGALFPFLSECMADKDIRLKQETLDLIQKLICLHDPSVTEQYANLLADRIIDALKETANSILTSAMSTARIFYSVLHDVGEFQNPKVIKAVRFYATSFDVLTVTFCEL